MGRGGSIPSWSSGLWAEPGLGERERPFPCVLSADPSSTVMGRTWGDERGGIPWAVAGLLAELAFAFPTQEDDDAKGAESPCADEPANSEAVPVIVERTVLIFWVVGIQSREACQEDEHAQGHLVHVGWSTGLEGPGGRVHWDVSGSQSWLQLPRWAERLA